MKKMAFIIVAAVVLILFGIYAYLGGFSDLHIHTENTGGETIVYQEITGDYKQTGAVADEIYYYLLNEMKIETYKGLGIFYDNPQKVEKEKLRADAGCIIEPKDIERLEAGNCRYKVKKLPQTHSIVAELPYNGNLSVLMGYLKAFPAIDKYREKYHLNDGPLISITDVPNKKVLYRKLIMPE